MTDFNWVEYLLPYVLGALGWLTLMGAFLWWLIWMVRKDDKKLQAAAELGKRLDRTSNGTRVHWFLDDPTEDLDPPVVPRYYDSGWKP